jgi:methylated-DNA-[protein]-cysteine S-methyltransferase
MGQSERDPGVNGIHRIETSLGAVQAAFDADGAVLYLGFTDHEFRTPLLAKLARLDPSKRPAREVLDRLREQLDAYAMGHRRSFAIPFRLHGSPFELRVWTALQRIPFGEVRSYGQLAAELGDPNSSRAVGRANGANPVSILVPCHRVVGTSGALTGYAGGLAMKERLLRLEGAIRE